jgi:hypothetical protein
VDVELRTPAPSAAAVALRAMPGVDGIEGEALRWAVRVSSEEMIPVVVAAWVSQGASIMRVNPRQYSLEDIYLRLQKENRP